MAKYKINGMVNLTRKEKNIPIHNLYLARNSYMSRLPQCSRYKAVHRIIKRK